MTRSTIFAPEEFYHLYNRGTEKRKIFMSDRDYERFSLLLYLCNQTDPIYLKFRGSTSEIFREVRQSKALVEIGAYCLMPNHFHLIVRELEDGGISKFMQKLLTGYTMYFNKLHERTGALFQGKFKAAHANEDRYLAYLISYIHLNPIKLLEPKWKETGIANRAGAEKYLEKYRYSSYLDHAGHARAENVIISRTSLPYEFESTRDFKAHVTDWLSYKSE